ncbi:MAG: hypothetical protein RMJ37_02190 [Spirochaetia bacterium]|nr:hypothetical protein [Spirochaetota bacterium]MCX8096552.1 hypothetical protein [Spirochaetota bacterium]MDW8112135.1 hypothetical protein [Spirochaetia bacterium]
MKRFILVTFTLLLIGSFAFGGSFGAYTGITEGISVGPSFHIPIDPFSAEVELMAAVGVLPKLDIQSSLSVIGIASEGVQWLGASIMPRYDLGSLAILNYNIFGLHLGYSDAFELGIEYHTEPSLVQDILWIELNLGFYALPTLSVSGIIAPVLSLQQLANLPLSIYFETDLEAEIEHLDHLHYSLIAGISVSVLENLEVNIGYNFSGSEIVGYLNLSF